jgi:hypothetical protein
MAFMKRILLLFFFSLLVLALEAQADTISLTATRLQKSPLPESASAAISIYPVPVKDNYFTIRSDREIAAIKITNIIGQDIFTEKYNNPLNLVRVDLDNPRRGMYLVTITLDDGTRIVKKIMIEQAE